MIMVTFQSVFFQINSHNASVSRCPSNGNLIQKDHLYAEQTLMCTGVSIVSSQTIIGFPAFILKVNTTVQLKIPSFFLREKFRNICIYEISHCHYFFCSFSGYQNLWCLGAAFMLVLWFCRHMEKARCWKLYNKQCSTLFLSPWLHLELCNYKLKSLTEPVLARLPGQ